MYAKFKAPVYHTGVFDSLRKEIKGYYSRSILENNNADTPRDGGCRSVKKSNCAILNCP